jgi:hypothetical protein
MGRPAVSMLYRQDFMGKTLMVKKTAEKCDFQERWNRNSKALKN